MRGERSSCSRRSMRFSPGSSAKRQRKTLDLWSLEGICVKFAAVSTGGGRNRSAFSRFLGGASPQQHGKRDSLCPFTRTPRPPGRGECDTEGGPKRQKLRIIAGGN